MIDVTIAQPERLELIGLPGCNFNLTIRDMEGQDIAFVFPSKDHFEAFRTALCGLDPKPFKDTSYLKAVSVIPRPEAEP